MIHVIKQITVIKQKTGQLQTWIDTSSDIDPLHSTLRLYYSCRYTSVYRLY